MHKEVCGCARYRSMRATVGEGGREREREHLPPSNEYIARGELPRLIEGGRRTLYFLCSTRWTSNESDAVDPK